MDDDIFMQVTRDTMEDMKRELGGGAEFTEEVEVSEVESQRMPDLYRDKQEQRREDGKKSHLRGCNAILKGSAEAAISRLEPQYRQFKGAYEHFKDEKQMDKAIQLKEQYQMEDFLPAVEALVLSSTPDELLNSKEILSRLDDLSGSGKGYTEAYLKQAYDDMLGQVEGLSDGEVAESVRVIRDLGAKGQTRGAMSVAKDIKRKIDRGENIASEEDYILISRVANF